MKKILFLVAIILCSCLLFQTVVAEKPAKYFWAKPDYISIGNVWEWLHANDDARYWTKEGFIKGFQLDSGHNSMKDQLKNLIFSKDDRNVKKFQKDNNLKLVKGNSKAYARSLGAESYKKKMDKSDIAALLKKK